MHGLEVGKLVVRGVNADAKEEASIAAIDDAVGAAEFDEVGLVLLIAWGDETVYVAF